MTETEFAVELEEELDKLNQWIETKTFRLKLPDDWTYEYKEEEMTVDFYTGSGVHTGELYQADFQKDEPAPMYIPNHATMESCAVIQAEHPQIRYGFLFHESPAGAVEQVNLYNHQFVIYDYSQPDYNFAYILTLSDSQVSSKQARAIIETFERKDEP
ncbi:hypothetical protein [Marinicrinis sediminis]